MTKYARAALKETWMILATWCGFCTWVMVACAGHYQPTTPMVSASLETAAQAGTPIVTVWGLPSWVFWGIAVPWMAATSLTIVLTLGWIKSDPVVEDVDE